MATLVPPSTGVRTATYVAKAQDGVDVELRWYTEGAGAHRGSAVVYAHGGGMIAGSLDLYDEMVSWYVFQTGVPFLAVQYRLAPEVGGSTLAADVYAGLTWLVDHATDLGVDVGRLAVMGDSGGGGPAAGAAIMARDNGVPLAKQLLVYPMLDDRNIGPAPSPLPCSPGATTTTSRVGMLLSVTDEARRVSRRSQRPPGSLISPALLPPTSRSGTWTSSAMSRLPTRKVSHAQEYPSSCTSIRGCHMASSVWARPPPLPNEH